MKLHRNLILCMLLTFGGSYIQAQEDHVDQLTIPFSDPDRPGFVEIGLLNGSIYVTGENRQDVQIESCTQTRNVHKSKNKKVDGMIRINAVSTELEVMEEKNRMEIDAGSHKATVIITVKVPYQTSLELGTVNNGDIQVKHIKGDIEADNVNGNILLNDISGSVIANTVNGKLEVVFHSVDPEKPMSFSAFNQDVDVTFPSALKANVKMKSEQGEIYSDFAITQSENPLKMVQEKSHEKNGKYHVRIERSFFGTINGGGPEFQFSSYNGDILIRKGE